MSNGNEFLMAQPTSFSSAGCNCGSNSSFASIVPEQMFVEQQAFSVPQQQDFYQTPYPAGGDAGWDNSPRWFKRYHTKYLAPEYLTQRYGGGGRWGPQGYAMRSARRRMVYEAVRDVGVPIISAGIFAGGLARSGDTINNTNNNTNTNTNTNSNTLNNRLVNRGQRRQQPRFQQQPDYRQQTSFRQPDYRQPTTYRQPTYQAPSYRQAPTYRQPSYQPTTLRSRFG